MPEEVLLSPGVLAIENDQSFVTQQPIQAGAAIIGPTVKGPVGIPTLVTTYSDYVNKFGTTFISGSNTYSYFTSISAYNYFQNGGASLLVTRVVSGSTNWTPATSSQILNATPTNAFVLETLSEGAIMNSTSTLNSDGTLPSGSANNFRWQIVSPNTASGTFSLIIRQGNDSTNSPSVLESWGPLSLDPFSSNYIEKVIGNQVENVATDGSDYYIQLSGSYKNNSAYIRVKQVNVTTPNYLDNSGNAKAQYTSSIPTAASGTFGAAVGSNLPTGTGYYYENINDVAAGSQGIPASEYNTPIYLLSNKDAYRFNFISAPGVIYDYSTGGYNGVINLLWSMCQNNGNSMAIIDTVGYGQNVSTTAGSTSGLDTSYAATYWPWLRTIDPGTGQQVWVPASTMIPGVYAFNDNAAEPWFAPAGTNRGTIPNAIMAERYLTQTNRDTLYEANVNPIAAFPNTGVTVFGQKTLQKKASALDRVNVRRLLIELKNYITQIADTLVFEQNTTATRNNFLLQVNPYLASVQQRQGLYSFRVVMDETNNTPQVIDNNQLVGAIYLQPTKTAEFIYLTFNVLPTGVSFE
jgi:phage tail sheath protein FI